LSYSPYLIKYLETILSHNIIVTPYSENSNYTDRIFLMIKSNNGYTLTVKQGSKKIFTKQIAKDKTNYNFK